ncbi:unnamed protein product [Prorocentrum cordatum]|uniref:peptidylprolyl isomerase n=1 Tax=Prorocentrum cordatum TaxID=2364126 RepID=A0ABN9THF0_9DINO|nr:unnamed protein product [Polarella glacialis]
MAVSRRRPRSRLLPVLGPLAASAALAASACCWAAAPNARSGVARRQLLVLGGAGAAGAVALGGAAPARAEASPLDDYKEGPQNIIYKVMKEGTGEKVQQDEQVQVTWDSYINGFPGEEMGPKKAKKIFSTEVIKPKTFHGVNLVYQIPEQFKAGDQTEYSTLEGVQLITMDMRVGERRRVIIPPELAYGRKTNPYVPGNSFIYLEIEVIDKGMPPPGANEQYYGQRNSKGTKVQVQTVAKGR